MSLLEKRPPPMLLLALMLTAAALACAAVLLTRSAAAPAYSAEPACDSDPGTTDCLAITFVSPAPGATDVQLSPPGASADFNQDIDISHLSKLGRVIDVDRGKDVTDGHTYIFAPHQLVINSNNPFKCGTTYKVVVARFRHNKPPVAVETESGLKLHEVPDGVTLTKRGVASWKFDTVAC